MSAQQNLTSLAIDQLRIATSSTEIVTARWALFRLADLELGRSNLGVSWLVKAFGDSSAWTPDF